MSWWLVDARDREAQRVTEDCALPDGQRFAKVFAETAAEAFALGFEAVLGPAHPLSVQARRRADATVALAPSP
jgi:hypothetical protein